MKQSLVKVVAILVTFGLVAQGRDDTLVEFASGTDVVEAVSTKIDSSCIFKDDNELLRRIAYVETTDGHDDGTFTSPEHKGMWKMSESMFKKSMAADKNILEKIQQNFQIDWKKTTWQDIQKPLHAGLAVRLFLLVNSKNRPIPREIKEQAQYWKMYYNSKESEQKFLDKVSNLEKGCSNGLADVVFLMDSSGSIGSSNFIKMKKFLKDVIATLNVGPNETHTRISVVSFGTKVKPDFHLDYYQTVEQYHKAIDNIKYLSEGTYTHLALRYLVDEAFKTSRGGRPENKGVPKLGITLTDGMSAISQQTFKEAARAHDAGINMISIGIGSVNEGELTAMASKPTCRHKFLLNGFSELDLIKDIIEKKSCEAPINFKPGNNDIATQLPAGGNKQCKIEVTVNGTTITVHPTDKGIITLYLSRSVYPNPANFDKKLTANSQYPAVEFLPGSPFVNVTVYCMLEGDKEVSVNISINLKPGNNDQCKINPCQNGGKCKNVVKGNYECECILPFTGKNCEHADQGYNCQNKNPCTPENIAAQKFYFPHEVKGKYVQCSEKGQCFEMNCPPGLSWNPTAYTCTLNNDQCKINPCQNGGKCKNVVNGNYECECILPFTGKNCEHADQGFNCQNKNPCTPENIAAQKLYFPHEVKGKYVQCSEWGQCFEMNCPPGLSWNPTAYTCTLNNDQCKINPCQNGGKCKNVVNGNYECECILPFSGKNCEHADQGFNCQNKYPCTPENIAARKFYFPHEVKGKYVQCSEWGQCFEMNCPSGLSWNPTANTCT